MNATDDGPVFPPGSAAPGPLFRPVVGLSLAERDSLDAALDAELDRALEDPEIPADSGGSPSI